MLLTTNASESLELNQNRLVTIKSYLSVNDPKSSHLEIESFAHKDGTTSS